MTASLLIFGPVDDNNGGGAMSPITRTAVLTTDESTASGVFANLLGPIELATSDAMPELLVMFDMSGGSSGGPGRAGAFRLLIDGSAVQATAETFGANPGSAALTFRTTGIAAGLHSIEVEWRRIADPPPGAITIDAATMPAEHHATLTVMGVTP